jgi:hypothetical protein
MENSDDGFDLLPSLAHSQDDPTLSRYLSARNEKIAGGVVLLQETDVRSHVRVDLLQAGLVDELDDEHGAQACIKRTPEVQPPQLRGFWNL